ncbi:MAG: four helix bundle protein [Bacteroidales bacterium]|nr:four helix bundle protein [Bacteroidales bacterium]
MAIKTFEDVKSWQISRELTVELYKIFNKNRDYSFRDQIQRASVSIMNNIAEGFERASDADFKRFLFYSKASCGEVRSMLYLAKDLDYIVEEQFNTLKDKSLMISRTIYGLIKSLN